MAVPYFFISCKDQERRSLQVSKPPVPWKMVEDEVDEIHLYPSPSLSLSLSPSPSLSLCSLSLYIYTHTSSQKNAMSMNPSQDMSHWLTRQPIPPPCWEASATSTAASARSLEHSWLCLRAVLAMQKKHNWMQKVQDASGNIEGISV